MPYSKVSDLPPGVKDNLPSAAAKIWMNVFNSSLKAKKGKKGAEDYARKVAWTAVKNAGYVKGKDGKWTKKDEGSTALDRQVLSEILPSNLKSEVNDPQVVPNVESYLLAPEEVVNFFVAAYESAMTACKNSKGLNCEQESFIMGLTKVRAMFTELPKGNWVKTSSINMPKKATLE
jgi:cation transport regulator